MGKTVKRKRKNTNRSRIVTAGSRLLQPNINIAVNPTNPKKIVTRIP
jgi:hypothetical protein